MLKLLAARRQLTCHLSVHPRRGLRLSLLGALGNQGARDAPGEIVESHLNDLPVPQLLVHERRAKTRLTAPVVAVFNLYLVLKNVIIM